MSVFESMYLPGGTGSGVGSGVYYTAGYRTFLERFMRDHEIKTVLDVGCGDWQFSKLVDWGNRLYVGQDEVEGLVTQLDREYGRFQRRFVHDIPPYPFDLVICKDVMIHLPNAEVIDLLASLAHHKHQLFVNDLDPTNAECTRGHYRALDITRPPFSIPAEIVYEFPQLNREHKVVHHRGLSCAT